MAGRSPTVSAAGRSPAVSAAGQGPALTKAGRICYNNTSKRRPGSDRRSFRFDFVSRKAALLLLGGGYFFMYPRIPKTITQSRFRSASTSSTVMAITSVRRNNRFPPFTGKAIVSRPPAFVNFRRLPPLPGGFFTSSSTRNCSAAPCRYCRGYTPAPASV